MIQSKRNRRRSRHRGGFLGIENMVSNVDGFIGNAGNYLGNVASSVKNKFTGQTPNQVDSLFEVNSTGGTRRRRRRRRANKKSRSVRFRM